MMRHGRPACISGNISAVRSENTVSSSAARVTGRRHSAWDRRNMAEIMMPAWLMPTQNTNVVMKSPQ